MATMNVSLPDPMKDWVESQAKSGRYSNASDYVRDLIRRDQERAGKLAELQKLLTEGLESGVSDRTIDEVLRAAGFREVERSAEGMSRLYAGQVPPYEPRDPVDLPHSSYVEAFK